MAIDKSGLIVKVYEGYKDGEFVEAKSWFPEAEALVFYHKSAEFFRWTKEDTDNLDPNIRYAASFHTIAQKCGDAAVKPSEKSPGAREEYETDPQEWIVDHVTSTAENLKGGTWVERGTPSGPRITLLAEAFYRALLGGKDEMELSAAVAVVGGWSKAQKEGAVKVKEIAKHLGDIKRERAEAKQKKLDEAAAESDGSGLAALLG